MCSLLALRDHISFADYEIAALENSYKGFNEIHLRFARLHFDSLEVQAPLQQPCSASVAPTHLSTCHMDCLASIWAKQFVGHKSPFNCIVEILQLLLCESTKNVLRHLSNVPQSRGGACRGWSEECGQQIANSNKTHTECQRQRPRQRQRRMPQQQSICRVDAGNAGNAAYGKKLAPLRRGVIWINQIESQHPKISTNNITQCLCFIERGGGGYGNTPRRLQFKAASTWWSINFLRLCSLTHKELNCALGNKQTAELKSRLI